MSSTSDLAALVTDEIDTILAALTTHLAANRHAWQEEVQTRGASSPKALVLMQEEKDITTLRERLETLVAAQDWTAAQCAEHWGVEVKTWHGYVAKGKAPKPAGHFGRTPYWTADEVRNWPRPGQGARTDRKASA